MIIAKMTGDSGAPWRKPRLIRTLFDETKRAFIQFPFQIAAINAIKNRLTPCSFIALKAALFSLSLSLSLSLNLVPVCNRLDKLLSCKLFCVRFSSSTSTSYSTTILTCALVCACFFTTSVLYLCSCLQMFSASRSHLLQPFAFPSLLRWRLSSHLCFFFVHADGLRHPSLDLASPLSFNWLHDTCSSLDHTPSPSQPGKSIPLQLK